MDFKKESFLKRRFFKLFKTPLLKSSPQKYLFYCIARKTPYSIFTSYGKQCLKKTGKFSFLFYKRERFKAFYTKYATRNFQDWGQLDLGYLAFFQYKEVQKEFEDGALQDFPAYHKNLVLPPFFFDFPT